MITSLPNDNCICFHGVSSDTKPTKYILNGSQFVEIDTNDIYLFNGEDKSWIKYKGGDIANLMAIDEKTYQFMGLSSDKKPTKNVGNGSRYIEMDSGKIFLYSSAKKSWLPFKGTGGGGGGECDCAVLKDELMSGLAIGNVTVGKTYDAGTPLEDIIRDILKGIKPEPATGTYFWGTFDETPTEIVVGGDWQSGTMGTSDTKTTDGIKVSFSTDDDLQYECFVYPAEFGALSHIKIDGDSEEQISLFTKSSVVVDSIEYYLYTSVDKVLAENIDVNFIWKK